MTFGGLVFLGFCNFGIVVVVEYLVKVSHEP
jgi:hypothetical protein